MAAAQKSVILNTAQIEAILSNESEPVVLDLKGARTAKGATFYTVLIKHEGTYSKFIWKALKVELAATVPSKEEQDKRPEAFNACDVTIKRSTVSGVNGEEPLGVTAEKLILKLEEYLESIIKKKTLKPKNPTIKKCIQTEYKNREKNEKGEKDDMIPMEDPRIRLNIAFPKDGLIPADAKPRFPDNYKMIKNGKRVPITVFDEEKNIEEPLMFGNIHKVFMRTSLMNMNFAVDVNTSPMGVSIKFSLRSFDINIRKAPAADRFTEEEASCLMVDDEHTPKASTSENNEGGDDAGLDF